MGLRSVAGASSAALVGAILGVAIAAGGALLLYAGEGALATAGFLLALTLATLAAALWVGAPDGRPASLRPRWIAAVLVLLVAGPFARLWSGAPGLRAEGWGRALAVLLLLAAPTYALASILVALDRRGRGVPIAALTGAAAGALAAAVVLIPRLDPDRLLLAAAGVLVLASWIEAVIGGPVPEREGGMLQGKVVIVTGVGAPGQVGFALAEAFRAEGARVVVTDVRPGIEAMAHELGGEDEIVGVAADLTKPEGAEHVIAAASGRFGRLDALVNTAGGLTVVKPLGDTTPEEWSREIDRNARTAFLMSRAALPLLRESHGSIVNFASPAGLRAAGGLAAYSAAKAAVVALTRALAVEERDSGVRVNAVAPGMIDTEQNRRGVEDPDSVRWVGRDEIARVVLFLVDEASSGISGETIQVLGAGVE